MHHYEGAIDAHSGSAVIPIHGGVMGRAIYPGVDGALSRHVTVTDVLGGYGAVRGAYGVRITMDTLLVDVGIRGKAILSQFRGLFGG